MAEQKQIVLRNRRARYLYNIEDTIEAGIVLVGTEVKSIRAGKANITEAYARVEDGEVWLYGMHISPYDPASKFNHDPRRKRKLLLKRSEIRRLARVAEQKGATLIPLSLYFRRGLAKIELGICHGKKQFERKRQIAERDAQRELARELSRRR